VTGGSSVRFKTGYDVDVFGGYDFGIFRIEGELGYKRSKLKSISTSPTFSTAVVTALNPTGTTGTAFVFPTNTASTFNLNGNVSVFSAMLNGLIDVGDENGVSFRAGAGIGRAWVKELGKSDNAWAFQGIAGVYYAISPEIDI